MSVIESKIDGFSDVYTITTDGKVFTTFRCSKREKPFFKDKKGYLLVTLQSKCGKTKSIPIHRLVARQFIPKVEGKNMVLHKDDNKQNNIVDNLYWGDAKDNSLDAIKNGGMASQSKNTVILTDEQIKEIRNGYKRRDRKFGAKYFSKKFKVSEQTIYRILKTCYLFEQAQYDLVRKV